MGLVIGFSQLVGSVAIIAWGKAADRSSNKNMVLRGLLLAAAGLCLGIWGLGGIPLVLLLAILATIQGPLIPLSDCISLAIAPRGFGAIRLWGTVGYAVAVVAAGFVFQQFSLALFFPSLVVIYFLSWYQGRGISTVPGAGGKKEQGLGSLFSNTDLNIFFVYGAIVYASLGFYINYYALFLRELGFGQGIVGVSFQVAALTELPFLLRADFFAKKFSTRGLISLAGFVFAARWLVVGSGIATVVLVSQLLHGFTYIVLYYAAISWLNSQAAPELKASAQSFHWLLATVSKLLGTAIGGWGAERIGLQSMFTLFGVVVLGATVLWRLIPKN